MNSLMLYYVESDHVCLSSDEFPPDPVKNNVIARPMILSNQNTKNNTSYDDVVLKQLTITLGSIV